MSALPEYGSNIGRFIRDHEDYVVRIGPMNTGYQAQKRGPDGHGAGQRFTGLTLDELAVKLRSAKTVEQALQRQQ